MTGKKGSIDSVELSRVIVSGMQEKKAFDIVVLDLRKLKNAIADFFVICSGSSDKQIDAIADSIAEQGYRVLQENPWHTEGRNNKQRMLLDTMTVVGHVL